jgi:hypothetical protein
MQTWFTVGLALSLAACTLIEDDMDGGYPPVDPELSSNPAPVGTNFHAVRDVFVSLDLASHDAPGSRVYLKIRDPRVGQLYLGRVDAQPRADVALSVLRITNEIEYELYDETGWRNVGTILLDE